MTAPFILKEDPNLPDAYGIVITFIDGKTRVIEAAEHVLINDGRNLSVLSFNDDWILIPLGYVRSIDFDKRYSTFKALARKKAS